MTRVNIITITLILLAAWIIFTTAAANNVYMMHLYAHTPGGPDTVPVNHIDGAYSYGVRSLISSAVLSLWVLYLALRKRR
ncbi:hypothetical protein ACUY3K_10475 [Corynebacterium uberis]|uniref:hypothetical protein n=1 Tax=Corynebacterium TaxID=1716 RepID=UPI001D0A1695|nr:MULTISPECIES: hypothetical protein [Corynebacterium]MCZ9310326.1 hypothetical protein [Corynebacterium sp. c6VSa_13]UDL73354.1 hypothetical protein LH391_09710 [Corynebacterium uberis]UDL75768.1 hypothetical protein LH393_11220 [Corynebacterium uberis]UDL77980.1 hypothetical protein LH394_11205 [Corynebacterium uberis]UDL80263.1 hypothetical protein LH392_00105 [Corynebacterium uberis]